MGITPRGGDDGSQNSAYHRRGRQRPRRLQAFSRVLDCRLLRIENNVDVVLCAYDGHLPYTF